MLALRERANLLQGRQTPALFHSTKILEGAVVAVAVAGVVEAVADLVVAGRSGQTP